MSKATFKTQYRTCLITVACVDWQGNPHAVGMSRLYRVSLRWENMSATGEYLGKLGEPVTLGKESATWKEVKEAVKSQLHLTFHSLFMRDWTPFYMVVGDACSLRMVKELRSIIADEHAFEGDEGLASGLPRVLSPDALVL